MMVFEVNEFEKFEFLCRARNLTQPVGRTAGWATPVLIYGTSTVSAPLLSPVSLPEIGSRRVTRDVRVSSNQRKSGERDASGEAV